MSLLILTTSATSYGTSVGTLQQPVGHCQSLSPMAIKSLTSNPLLDHSGLPRFDEIQPVHVKAAIEDNLQALKTDFESLEAAVKAGQATNYGEVVEELERIQAPLGYSWGVVGHLMGG